MISVSTLEHRLCSSGFITASGAPCAITRPLLPVPDVAIAAGLIQIVWSTVITTVFLPFEFNHQAHQFNYIDIGVGRSSSLRGIPASTIETLPAAESWVNL
ncbi:hypothetical protein EJB31_25815 [Klebsiella pneumoniae]|uniref:hypothetical protein n=1 Tax=Klebsiella pneumoniae TaxID=573 RepID=UPI0013E91458|nr:hypothetical protein [Klebsiella pneumoniae]NGX69047.1 hypothetical protein [Klebsiella pneumoniae]